MPTNKSNFSRYKIPDNLDPSGICCISVPVPNDREYIAQFMGAIWRMSLQTHYERDDAHSAVTVAAIWRQIWEDMQVSGCCQPGIGQVVINSQINLEIQVYLTTLWDIYVAAGLDIEIAWPDTPDDYDSDPGDVGDAVAQRSRALCIAVESMVNEMCNRALNWMESQVPEAAALIAAGVALPWVSTPFVLGAFFVGGFIAGEVVQELIRQEYRDYLTCGIVDALTGADSNSFAAWEGSMDSLPVRPPPAQNPAQGLARDLIERWMRTQINNKQNYLSFIQTLNLSMTTAEHLSDTDCVCNEGWEVSWAGGFNEAGDWTPLPYTTGWPVTTYNAPEDRWEGTCVTNAVVGARVRIQFPSTTITRVRVSSEWGSVRVTAFQNTDIWGIFDPPGVPPYVIHECGHGTGVGSHVCDTGAIVEVLEEINIRSAAGVFGCPNPAAWSYITKIIINGTGTNPFA